MELVKARKEKQRADKARAKLIKADKELLTGFMQKIKAPELDPTMLKSSEGKKAFFEFATGFDSLVDTLKTDIENLS